MPAKRDVKFQLDAVSGPCQFRKQGLELGAMEITPDSQTRT
jgi:hypothetical protein